MISAAFQTRVQAALDASAAFRTAADTVTEATNDAPTGIAGWFGRRNRHVGARMSTAVSQVDDGLRALRLAGIRDTDRGVDVAAYSASLIESARRHPRGPETGLRDLLTPVHDRTVASNLRLAAERVLMAPIADPPHGATVAERLEAAEQLGMDITDWAPFMPAVHVDQVDAMVTSIRDIETVAPDLAPLVQKVVSGYLLLQDRRSYLPRYESAGRFDADFELLKMQLLDRGIESPVRDLSGSDLMPST